MSTSAADVIDRVDIEPLKRYLQSADGRRPEQREAYVKMRDAKGEKREDGMSPLRQRDSLKVVNGEDIGRLYSEGISRQSLAREARRAAFSQRRVGLDIANFFATCILLLYHTSEFPALRRNVLRSNRIMEGRIIGALWRRQPSGQRRFPLAHPRIRNAAYGFRELTSNADCRSGRRRFSQSGGYDMRRPP